jgi:hypothetical protein
MLAGSGTDSTWPATEIGWNVCPPSGLYSPIRSVPAAPTVPPPADASCVPRCGQVWVAKNVGRDAQGQRELLDRSPRKICAPPFLDETDGLAAHVCQQCQLGAGQPGLPAEAGDRAGQVGTCDDGHGG